MTKHERLIRDMVSKLGFRLVHWEQRSHIKARLVRPDGLEVTAIFPVSPSCHHWRRNKERQLVAMLKGPA